MSHSQVWRRAQEYAAHIPHPIQRLRNELKNASLILVLDATHLRIRGKGYFVHIAYDTHLGPIHFAVDDSENATAYSVMLNMLEKEGYKPIAVVSDGHWGIRTAVKDWNLPQQRCVFHLLQDLRRMLVTHGELKGANKVLYSRLKGIWKAKTIEALADRVNQFRKIVFCFRRKKQLGELRDFWEGLHEATLHLSFKPGEVPRTSNILENLNGQIKARTKTMRGVKSKASLINLLKILFYFRSLKGHTQVYATVPRRNRRHDRCHMG
ncbi:MAG: transposase [Candidatus Altimarinota bacterium]